MTIKKQMADTARMVDFFNTLTDKDVEMIEFIDGLPVSALNDAAEFFQQIPTLLHTINYTCATCETKNNIVINGYDHFFG